MFDALKERLVGCFYTVFTPFDEDEAIDYEALEKYVTVLFRQGARRFYVMPYNSRYSQLSDDEIRALNEFCIRATKALHRENLIIVGDPIHCSTRTSIEFSRHAADAGADLVSLIVREKYFCDEQILEHYATVGQESGMPLLVHEMPFLSGFDGRQMHWPPSLVERLPRVSQIVALKEDAKEPEVTRRALGLEPDVRIIIAGMKRKFMAFRQDGARAYLNGISIIDARIGEMFWRAYEENDEETIRFVIEELEAPFFEECAARYGWHRVNKALLHAAGLMHRRDRMPLKQLNDEEFLIVQSVYARVRDAWATREEART